MPLPIYNISTDIKWVFLDLDDTLWDFTANSIVTLKQLFNNHKYLLQWFGSFDNFANRYHIFNNLMWAMFERGETDAETVKRRRFELLLEEVTGTSDARDKASVLQREYLQRLGQQTVTVPGAIDLLSILSKRYMIGILSNGFREVQYRKIYVSGLWRYVQRMVLSDEAGVSKPSELIFRFAEQATGALPGSTVMIGDNPKADISGALAAGWGAIYFDRRLRDDTPDGALRVTSLNEVASILT